MPINGLESRLQGSRADSLRDSGALQMHYMHQIVQKYGLKHRIDAFDDQPDAVAHDLVRLQLDDVEVLAEFGQPPGGRFLDQVGITAVGQHFTGRAHVNGKEPDSGGDAGQFGNDVIDELGFDMLKHIDTADQISRLWGAVFRECRVVGFVDRADAGLLEANL